MKFLTQYIPLFSTFHRIYSILFPRQKQKAGRLILLIILNSFIDIIGLATVLPVINIAINQELIHKNIYLNTLYQLLHFSSNKQFLITLFIAMIAVFILKNIIGIIISYIQFIFSFNISKEFSLRQFYGYYNKNLMFFREGNSSILAHNIANAPAYFSQFIILPAINIISEFFVLSLILIALAIYNFQILLLLLVTIIPVFLLVNRIIKNKIHQLEKENNELAPLAIRDVLQGVGGYLDVKLFNKEQYFVNQFIKKQERLNTIRTNSLTYSLIPNKLIEIAAIITIILILVYSLYINDTSKENLLLFLSIYVAAAYRSMPSINRIIISMMNLKGYDFVFEILKNMDRNINHHDDSLSPNPFQFKNNIQLLNLSYTYPGETHAPALKNINLTINKGEVIGIVGQSGSGKSTLINVLLGFLQHQQGQLHIDNTPFTQENYTQWRNTIGYVRQDIFILDGTIADNIAFAVPKSQVDKTQLHDAIKLAGLKNFIDALPKKEETHIGENASKISGGQKQRIAIARALYRHAQLLIFDEATSSLDVQTENEILESIQTLAQQKITILIVAHKPNILKCCNKIYEMKQGTIINAFSHSEFINKVHL